MRTGLRFTLVVALVGALFAPASSSAAPAEAGCASQWLEVYDVRLSSDRKAYRLRDSAKIVARVTEKQSGSPVEGAEIIVGLLARERYDYDSKVSRTNENGVARLRFPLRDLAPGWVDLQGFARTYYNHAEAICAGIGFYGQTTAKKAFRITR
jgi:hypothetical protein